MEIISGLIFAAYSFRHFLDDLLTYTMFGFFPVSFLVFLVLTIVQIVKKKKTRPETCQSYRFRYYYQRPWGYLCM